MASSPQYLAHSAHNQLGTSTPTPPDCSCHSGEPATTSAYPNPDQIYSSVSAFEQPAVVDDDHLLTPESSAASPPLHPRSKVQSPYHQPQDSPQFPQQPTPPNTSTMFPYSDYINGTSQASSPMPIQTTVTQAPHDFLGPYIQDSPGHEDSIPPPQTAPYFGQYTASTVSVGQEIDGLTQYYLTDGTNENRYGAMSGTSYANRPLAPNFVQQPQQGQYRRDRVPISRLSSTNYGRPTRHPSRKPSARRSRVKQEQSSSSPKTSQTFGLDDAGRSGEPVEPEPSVELDQKAPADLRRLWKIRQKWFSRKGHGMWENIIKDYLGAGEAESLSDDKKTKVKANLQMKIHRGVLRHGEWPARDRAALLRAYARWEENRYNEVFKLFMEELRNDGTDPAYEWKSVHVEAELVKSGLEQKQREPSKARRRRIQVPARHRASGGATPLHTKSSSIHLHMPYQQQPHRLPAMMGLTPGFAPYPSQHYAQQEQHPYHVGGGHRREISTGSAAHDSVVQELRAHPPPALTEEEHEKLMEECLEREQFENGPEDPVMAALERHNNSHYQHDDTRMSDDPYPEEQLPRNSSPPSSLLPAISGMIASAPASPDINAQRSQAVARQACGEILKHSDNASSHHQ